MDPLFATVLRDPNDDALRQVWADALQERGDPRGELIAIQIACAGRRLNPQQDKRVRSLIAKHTRAWLGPLDDVIMRRAGLVFDRGVIASCQIQIKSLDALALAIGHPLWSTVRKIWFCDRYAWDARIVSLLVHPSFRVLDDVTCIGVHNVFGALAAHDRPLPFSSVWTVDDTWRARDASALLAGPAGDAPALPALRRLGFTITALDSSWIFRLPMVQRLETLGLTVEESVGDCLRRAETLPALRTLELRPKWTPSHGLYLSHCVLSFGRTRNAFDTLSIARGGLVGRFSPRLEGVLLEREDRTIALARRFAVAARALEEQLESIPPDALRQIDVHVPEDAELRRSLARFRRAEIRFIESDASPSSR
jgi:uncharacterized protein (TIGR02996 family)